MLKFELCRFPDVKLTDDLKQSVTDARKDYEKTIKSLDLNIFEYHKMGRNFARKVQISPDLIMQLCFQVSAFLKRNYIFSYVRIPAGNICPYSDCTILKLEKYLEMLLKISLKKFLIVVIMKNIYI